MAESQLQAAVIDMCDHLGLACWHDHDSRRNRAGFPDLVIVGSSVLYVELKTDTGRVRPEQQIWIDALNAAGARAVLWRPQHLRSGEITRTLLDMSSLKPGRRLAEQSARRRLGRRG